MEQVLGQMPSQQMSTLPTPPASSMPPIPPAKGGSPRFFKLYLPILIFLILALAGFILALNRYGKFWERKPVPPPITQLPTPTVSPWASNPLVQKAKEIGYNIIWMDPNDTVGRTVFYDWRGPYGNGGIGEQTTKNPDQSTYTSRVTGVFQEFRDISNSLDKYLTLANPKTNQPYQPIRVILDPQETSTLSTKPTLPFTQVLVENLNTIVNVATQSGELLGEFRKFTNSELQNIFKSGDAISTILWPTYTTDKKALINARDNYGNSIVWRLYIRRFGGKAEIEKEPSKNL